MDRPIYRPVKEFPWYLACSDGYVINTDTGHVLVGSIKKTGYREILLVDADGNPHSRLLHRVIAQAFVENEENKPEVNHINGDKDDNRALNLEWVTRGENLKHAYENGLMPNNTTPKRVTAVGLSGAVLIFDSIYQAAKETGISKGNICMCCRGARPAAGGFVWSYFDE